MNLDAAIFLFRQKPKTHRLHLTSPQWSLRLMLTLAAVTVVCVAFYRGTSIISTSSYSICAAVTHTDPPSGYFISASVTRPAPPRSDSTSASVTRPAPPRSDSTSASVTRPAPPRDYSIFAAVT